jgi:hypothetical protein
MTSMHILVFEVNIVLRDVVWDVKHRIRWKGKFSKSDVNIALCESWGLDLDILH